MSYQNIRYILYSFIERTFKSVDSLYENIYEKLGLGFTRSPGDTVSSKAIELVRLCSTRKLTKKLFQLIESCSVFYAQENLPEKLFKQYPTISVGFSETSTGDLRQFNFNQFGMLGSCNVSLIKSTTDAARMADDCELYVWIIRSKFDQSKCQDIILNLIVFRDIKSVIYALASDIQSVQTYIDRSIGTQICNTEYREYEDDMQVGGDIIQYIQEFDSNEPPLQATSAVYDDWPDPPFNPENGITILHISDLHISEKDSVDSIVTSLIGSIKHKKVPIHFVVISGDLTSEGKRTEFSLALDFSRRLSQGLGVRAECFIVAIGNHDMDWSEEVYSYHDEKESGRSVLRKNDGLFLNYIDELHGRLIRDEGLYWLRFRRCQPWRAKRGLVVPDRRRARA